MIVHTNELQVLSDLKNCFANGKKDIDIGFYELIDSYLENPFNISEDDLNKINDFISSNTTENSKITVITGAPNRETLTEKLDNIVPLQLSKPTAPIRSLNGKLPNRTVIPIYTNVKELKLVAWVFSCLNNKKMI